MKNAATPQSPVVFIDDAHTFGGTQVALAWTIHTILSHTSIPILCVCTERTRSAIEDVTGPHSRITFRRAPPALPLNILSFPVRLIAYAKLLGHIRRQPVQAWWLNLADIEFCLAPLVVLRAYGEKTHSYLHGTARFGAFYKDASRRRRALSWFRDLLAEKFVYRLHHLLVAPSLASQTEVQIRSGRSATTPVGHLYYPPIGRQAQLMKTPFVEPRPAGVSSIDLWMIGGVAYGHKNNLAALGVLKLLIEQGHEATLTVAGTGPDMPHFKQEARARGLSSRITYLGWIADPCDIAPKQAIVLIPSFQETMNIVAREAMRNGLRIVVSPIPVFREWIPESLIAANFSNEAFCAKSQEVCAMPAREISDSYAMALARFSNEVFVEQFLRFSQV